MKYLLLVPYNEPDRMEFDYHYMDLSNDKFRKHEVESPELAYEKWMREYPLLDCLIVKTIEVKPNLTVIEQPDTKIAGVDFSDSLDILNGLGGKDE